MSAFTILSPRRSTPSMPLQSDPEAPTPGRADRAMTLMVMLAQGKRELSHSVLGLIGWDDAARDLVNRASVGFGMRVHVFVPAGVATPKDLPANVRISDTIQTVLRGSDFVSLHGPRSPSQPAVMTAERMNLMREDAFLINTSDAGLVNELALTQALWFETIGGAGLDLSDRTDPLSPNLRECDQLVTVCSGVQSSKIRIFPAAQAR